MLFQNLLAKVRSCFQKASPDQKDNHPADNDGTLARFVVSSDVQNTVAETAPTFSGIAYRLKKGRKSSMVVFTQSSLALTTGITAAGANYRGVLIQGPPQTSALPWAFRAKEWSAMIVAFWVSRPAVWHRDLVVNQNGTPWVPAASKARLDAQEQSILFVRQSRIGKLKNQNPQSLFHHGDSLSIAS